jgi:hypothetical protein
MRPDIIPLILAATIIFGGGIAGIYVFMVMAQPLTPSDAFQKDNKLVEYCYMNITSVGDNPVRYNMETHMEKVYTYHEECLDRNLNITSVSGMRQMETKKFGNYAVQGRVYVKYSGNGTGALMYGDLV